MGHCRYILARDCATNTFEVLVENTPCGTDDTVTCTKTVIVNVNGTSILLQKGGSVSINSVEIVLPYKKSGKGQQIMVVITIIRTLYQPTWVYPT